MSSPPFRLAAAAQALSGAPHLVPGCCDHAAPDTAAEAPAQRMRLTELDPHLHCSVIGTCLGTAELRKLMAKFIDVHGASDLHVHHEAVALAAQGGEAARTLQRLLDRRHEPVLRRFARVRDPAELERLWNDALRQGEVPGAYWALLTHRAVTPGLRQQVFGDVHMLSHLCGASHRAGLRRDAALEHDNAELRERLEQQHERLQALEEERLQLQATIAQQAGELAAARARASEQAQGDSKLLRDSLAEARALLALHTERRERAEQTAAATETDNARLRLELEHGAQQTQALALELAAAEQLLREQAEGHSDAQERSALARQLDGRRVLYVGGRPSSAVAIRELVQRHGGELQRHDGGLEDRKGLLASGVAWAEVVVFPVDCIDHDSAGQLKRLCQRDGKPLLPLRSASVTSFAAALLRPDSAPAAGSIDPSAACRRHA